jgi:hypothetical protein
MVGEKDSGPLNGAVRVAVVVGRLERRGVLTQWRLEYMVEALDLEEMTARKKKLRTGSATDASTVENTSVLGLGFNPNQHNNKKKQENKIGHQIRCKRSTTTSQAACRCLP